MLNPVIDPNEINSHAYGKGWSAQWDEYFGTRPDTADAVEFLAKLAENRLVLEFGIGTGRLALPLQGHGVQIHGIDNSVWMVEELRTKPEGAQLPVTVGDLTDITLPDRYGLIFFASNGILALTSQDLQVRCFEQAAAHLEPNGVFVIEAMSPTGIKVEPSRCRTAKIDTGVGIISLTLADTVTQEMQQSFIFLEDGKPPRVRATASRYCWPSELDLMARIAGLQLRERWSGWDRSPFTADSVNHVSVYEQG